MDRSSTSGTGYQGVALGLVAVGSFSLSLPATRLAVIDLDPTFVALGRAIVAACLAAVVLAISRSPIPRARQWLRLAATSLGVVVGFPLFSSWAMRFVPAAHGAVVVGLLPLATALFGVTLAGERPRAAFWVSTLIGSAAIVAFSLWSSQGAVEIADLLLLAAVIAAGFGYAEGARLSAELGAWQTISWALVIAAPVLLIPAWLTRPPSLADVSATSLAGFSYVSLVSMFLGFFAWYKALALGGIARVGQLQLLQPFMTLIGAAVLLGESIELMQCLVAGVVLVCIVAGRRAVLRQELAENSARVSAK